MNQTTNPSKIISSEEERKRLDENVKFTKCKLEKPRVIEIKGNTKKKIEKMYRKIDSDIIVQNTCIWIT